MTTLTAPVETEKPTNSDDDDLHHHFCCDEDRSLCGLDMTDWPVDENPKPEDICVVCHEMSLASSPCNPDCPIKKETD